MANDATSNDNVQSARLTILFRGMQRGDVAAFDELYEQVRRPMMAYCIALSASEDEAKDLFHTTMLKVYEFRNTFRGDNAAAWMFAIARNTARSYQRQRKRLEPLADDYEAHATAPTGLDDDEKRLIGNAIARLRPEYRTIVMLKYYGDLSVAEIADAEDISRDLVKTRLHRARIELAHALGKVFLEKS